MARTVSHDIPTDTALFSPFQLLPSKLFSFCWSGLARWLRQYLVSFPSMLKDHGMGVVPLGVSLEYQEPFRFFDHDNLTVSTVLRVRRGGGRLQVDVAFLADSKKVAVAELILCPVKVDNLDSLAASPAELTGELRAKFLADEIDDVSPNRRALRLLGDISAKGELIAENRLNQRRFFIGHERCEVADQWSWIELASIVADSREWMSLDLQGQVPDLRKGLKTMRSFDAEFRRPFQIFDEGRVETKAYRYQERIAYVHHLYRSTNSAAHGELCTIVVEQF